MRMNKKGLGIGDLQVIAVIVGTVAMVGGVIGIVLNSFSEQVSNESVAYTIIDSGIDALSALVQNLPLIGTIVGLVILLAIVLGAFKSSQ